MDTRNIMKKIHYFWKPEPVIYIRVWNGVVTYVGETCDIKQGRPFRYDTDIGNYDKIYTIKACKNDERRRYWEAYCVVKFKPLLQKKIKGYYKKLEKNITEEQIHKNTEKKFPIFNKNNLDNMIKQELKRKILACENLISAEKNLKLLKKERSKHENNSIRTTRHWQDNNVVEQSR